MYLILGLDWQISNGSVNASKSAYILNGTASSARRMWKTFLNLLPFFRINTFYCLVIITVFFVVFSFFSIIFCIKSVKTNYTEMHFTMFFIFVSLIVCWYFYQCVMLISLLLLLLLQNLYSAQIQASSSQRRWVPCLFDSVSTLDVFVLVRFQCFYVLYCFSLRCRVTVLCVCHTL